MKINLDLMCLKGKTISLVKILHAQHCSDCNCCKTTLATVCQLLNTYSQGFCNTIFYFFP